MRICNKMHICGEFRSSWDQCCAVQAKYDVHARVRHVRERHNTGWDSNRSGIPKLQEEYTKQGVDIPKIKRTSKKQNLNKIIQRKDSKTPFL